MDRTTVVIAVHGAKDASLRTGARQAEPPPPLVGVVGPPWCPLMPYRTKAESNPSPHSPWLGGYPMVNTLTIHQHQREAKGAIYAHVTPDPLFDQGEAPGCAA